MWQVRICVRKFYVHICMHSKFRLAPPYSKSSSYATNVGMEVPKSVETRKCLSTKQGIMVICNNSNMHNPPPYILFFQYYTTKLKAIQAKHNIIQQS